MSLSHDGRLNFRMRFQCSTTFFSDLMWIQLRPNLVFLFWSPVAALLTITTEILVVKNVRKFSWPFFAHYVFRIRIIIIILMTHSIKALQCNYYLLLIKSKYSVLWTPHSSSFLFLTFNDDVLMIKSFGQLSSNYKVNTVPDRGYRTGRNVGLTSKKRHTLGLVW